MIRVVHIKKYQPIKNEILIKIDRSSVLGNPFIMDKESERNEVCRMYVTYFDQQVKIDGDFRNEIIRIYRLAKEGKNIALACWCAPKQCHGDYIKQFVEGYLVK